MLGETLGLFIYLFTYLAYLTFSIGKIGVERAHISFGLIEYQTN
jgi:hypothetical protein